MASVESPVASPAPGWARRFPRDERVFMALIVVTGVLMFGFVLGWLFLADQNVPTSAYRTSPEAFAEQVAAFTEKYQQADGKVHVPPGVDAYMLAARYTFFPELVLKAGEPYRIWISSADVLHGFSLVGRDGSIQNLNLEIAPNHAYGATITPDEPGTYLIVCNEYCGLGHHEMKGRIVVER